MAKKKKAAANPARGFATTSIASKPKLDKTVDQESKSPKAEPAEHTEPNAGLTSETTSSAQKTVVPTPEELEAQLERDELQLLVEKHASKTRRESKRHVSKFQTDRRVLRAQAQSMAVHDWLSDDMLNTIVSLARTESNDSNRKQGQQSFLKILSEEDAVSKLWALEITFRDLGFSPDQVQAVLKWLCANAANIDASVSPWGFQEGLEWISLNQSENHPYSYDEPKNHTQATESPTTSRPGTPIPLGHDLANGNDPKLVISNVLTSDVSNQPAATSAELDHSDAVVSDLGSDIEPDQLVPTYLRIKGRLFEIDPDAMDPRPKKQAKDTRVGSAPSSTSKAVRKLYSQLQQIESDALFDKSDAEVQWPAMRNQIARTKAAAGRSPAGIAPSIPGQKSQRTDSPPAIALGQSSQTNPVHSDSDEDEASLLGDMFSAIPDESPQEAPSSGTDPQVVNLRDFGKQSGPTPRRILEEAVHARDPGARLTYKLVSPTTYSCRHSLTIIWSKSQDIIYEAEIVGVSCDIQKMLVLFMATSIATVSVEQSEALISTAALFSLFAASSKEEKIYLRLPSTWRDLYRSFLDTRKDRIDAGDRDAIWSIRSLIRDQIDNEELEGVVLTSRFKLRNQAAVSSSASNSGRNTPSLGSENVRDFWIQKSSTMGYQRMLLGRMNLPVFNFRPSILSAIDKHQVTIVCGETGCGKSTQIPSFILEHELSQGKPCKIYCTEPRRISAISLAQRVSDELGEAPKDLGTIRSLVGYAIRLETKTSSQTRLVYATVGVVLRMLEGSKGLNEVTHLIIDEVHERSIDTDFLLIILRSLMLTRPDLKVILMSATVDALRFSKYLNDAPVLNIPGRTYPVQTKFLEDAIEFTHYASSPEEIPIDHDTSGNEEEESVKEKSGIPSKLPGYSPTTRSVLSNYDEYGIDYGLIVRLIEAVSFDSHLSLYSNAFLVFLPGIAEIRQLNDLLLGHPTFDKGWVIYPLHSTISSDDQQAAFVVPPPGVRKIVLATNIAETGVTIPDITCVVDTGKHKEMRFDERRQLSRLTQSFISRANAKQRRGRAGRVQEGLCFHLFTSYRHDNLMMDQQTPEMLRLSLQDLVMRTKICKLGDIEQTLSEALDPPSSRNIRRAIDALIEVDALTPGEELTPLGRQIAKLPLDAHLGKLVLLSSVFGCVDVAITIAAVLSSKSPFLTPFNAKQRADAARLAFKKGDSDLLTTYNAYKSWKAVCTTAGRSEAQFCHKNFLSAQNLGNIEDLKAQLLSSLVEAGFVQLSPKDRQTLSRYRSTSRHRMFISVPEQYDIHSENDILVNSVIATAFYPKILVREGKGWRNISNNQTVSLAPTSVNRASSVNIATAKFLSYYHIMQSSNKFYNAHSTSIIYPLPTVLLVGADMDFKLHAGVISLPGNVLRFAVKDWRATVALKSLRRRVKEILAAGWRNPGRQLSDRENEWLGLFFKIFVDRHERDEKIRERTAAKGK